MLIRKLKWVPDKDGMNSIQAADTYIGRYEAHDHKWELWDNYERVVWGNSSSTADAMKSCEKHWCDVITKHFVEI